MGETGHAESFKDLLVYQKARQLDREVFEITKRLPDDEKYSLTSQLRRSSRSIGAQISEAWAKRRYPNHFVSKLSDAAAEENETVHWLETALDCGYLSSEAAARLNGQAEEIGRMLSAMARKADLFCGEYPKEVRESAPEYFV